MISKVITLALESCLEINFCPKPGPSARHYTGTRKADRNTVYQKFGNLPSLH